MLENSDLRKRLLDQSQDQHRQAGPFSRNKPKADPKPPGRKSGKKYGKHHCGAVPERIDEVHTAPLPDSCPSCQSGDIITEKVSPQYQVELPTKMVHRRFEVELGCCRQCGKRLQGHHELQTSDALGVAGVTLVHCQSMKPGYRSAARIGMMVANHGGLSHAEEIYCTSVGCGTSNAGQGRRQVQGVVIEGAASAGVAQGGCGRSRLDRRRDRRCVWLPNENGREHSRALRCRRLRSDAGGQVAGGTASEIARWRTGGEGDRDAFGIAAGGLCELDIAVVGRAGGGAGNRGIDQSRDGASHAKKNGMTKRKIAYWVIPPEADGEFVAAMEDVLEIYSRPYDALGPVLCMDEQPIQLLKETR